VNPKDLIGVTKAPLRLVPPALTIGVAPVMALGAKKYGAYNWRKYPVKLSVYLEAIERHLLAVMDGQWVDPESGQPHVAHIAAGVGIILDALATESLVEDWPIAHGPAAELLAAQAESLNARSMTATEASRHPDAGEVPSEYIDGPITDPRFRSQVRTDYFDGDDR
jgi:hypothetical protein